MNLKDTTLLITAALAVSTAVAGVSVKQETSSGAKHASIENDQVKLSFNLKTGTYSVYNKVDQFTAIKDAMVVVQPGKIEAGSTSDFLMTGTDYYPTLLDLAGLPLRNDQNLDGVSLKPVLLGKGTVPERSLFWHYPHYHRTTPYGAIRKGKWKLTEFFEDGALELDDLDKDMAETVNLAEKNPETAQALLQELKTWRASVNAQMPTPNPNYDPNDPNRKRGKSRKKK